MVIKTGRIDLKLDQGALGALLGSTSGPVGKELGRLGAQIEGEAKKLLSNDLVNVQTGRLRSSTTHVVFTSGRQVGVAIGSAAFYGVFVHAANRPYLTRAAERIFGRPL